MTETRKYHVVVAESAQDLAAAVNALMQKECIGWYGSLVVAADGKRFFQAVVTRPFD